MLMIVGLFASNLYLFGSTNALETARVDLSPEERQWITRHPEMRVGMEMDWAPFSYVDPDGNQDGISIDILKLISQRTGLRFELLPRKSWEELVANRDQIDMVCNIAQSPLRELVANFTQPYSSAPSVIVEREGEETFGTAAVLGNKKLALPRGHIVTQKVTARLPSAPVILAATQQECFELVAKKKANATIANLFVASHYLNSHPEIKLAISGVISEFDQPIKMAVRRDLGDLPIAILNKGLASITQEEMDQIVSKHLLFGLQSRERLGLVEKRAQQVLLAVALVGLLVLFWNLFMRKEILARRKAEAELRERNESMRIFSHSLSHDLRVPLRGITGFAQALKEDHYEKLDREGQDYLERIIQSGSRMDDLIADVLDYSGLSNSEWRMEIVELDPLVHQLIEEFPPEKRQFFQIVSGLPAVRGNGTLLNQCMTNLLSNAIKFVPGERTPKVVIRAKQENSQVTIFVEDNGIGIKPEDQDRIFKIFERAAPADYKGTGIGLAVVAKTAERMGGKVGVQSEFGKGSRFWIRLPGLGAKKSAGQTSRLQPFRRRLLSMRGT
jgi:signal transduction histidine kinase